MRLDVAFRLLQPIVDVLEGAAVGDVEEEEPAHGVTVVSPGDGPATVTKWYNKQWISIKVMQSDKSI